MTETGIPHVWERTSEGLWKCKNCGTKAFYRAFRKVCPGAKIEDSHG